MAENTLKKQTAQILYLEDAETKVLEGTMSKILNDYYSEIELKVSMPSKILKSAISLHEIFFAAYKIKIEEIEKIGDKADLQKNNFLKEKELKQIELHKKEIAEAIVAEEDIKVANSTENTPEEPARAPTTPKTQPIEIAINLNFETIEQFFVDKSAAFQLTSLNYLMGLKKLAQFHEKIKELFIKAQKRQQIKIGLFEKIISNKSEGLGLQESLQQESFDELVAEFSELAKRMDATKTINENTFLKKFLHQFKSEPHRNYEMLSLIITMKQCKNSEVRLLLEKLYKKWPQKNEQKDKRIILNLTKQVLGLE